MFGKVAEQKIPPQQSPLSFTLNTLWDNPGSRKV